MTFFVFFYVSGNVSYGIIRLPGRFVGSYDCSIVVVGAISKDSVRF